MAKLSPFYNGQNEIIGYSFQCPGCKDMHSLHVRPNKAANGASWEFNDNVDKPTFNPSVLTRYERTTTGEPIPIEICHAFVTDGVIRFLGDCTHELANQTIEMPEYQIRTKESKE